jgi:hypothetical protein
MVNQATISRTFCSSHAPKVTNRSSKIKKRFLTPFPHPTPLEEKHSALNPKQLNQTDLSCGVIVISRERGY